MSEETKKNKFRGSLGRFAELEDKLYFRIDGMRQINLPVPSSLAILKTKQLAEQLSISQEGFKASWQWFNKFGERRRLR